MTLPTYTVAVRELCEFAKEGDLDLRFTPAPTAEEGMAGHKVVAGRRGGAYRAEVALEGRFEELIVRGRADGFDAERGLLEEVKTFKGDLSRLPSNQQALHWAQAQIYAAMLCRERGLLQLTVSLVYFDVASQRETPVSKVCSAAELQQVFDALCGRFLCWARRQLAQRAERDAALNALGFPYAQFRAGQRTLAEQTFRAAQQGLCLTAQAPTGIGKTLATIFPLLKAAPAQRLDKLFVLTAKGPGRAVALGALRQLDAGRALPWRVLELVARDKTCEHPDKACHGESCPLARGFYDRLPAARAEAAARGWLDQAALRDVARTHAVCPYYLSQDMVRWCDVVVGDYNYYFDRTALLHGLAVANGWRVALLVDEAHNLIDRGRAMYSAELHEDDLRRLRPLAPAALGAALTTLQRVWRTLSAELAQQPQPYAAHDQPDPRFSDALRTVNAGFGDFLAEQPHGLAPALLRFYFDTLQFARLTDSFGRHSLFDVSAAPQPAAGAPPSSTLCIRNVVPAPFLRPRFAAAHSAVLFSATLSPQRFYADLLGLPDTTLTLDVAAPFASAQLTVQIADGVSTRYADRALSLAPIAALIAAQYRRAAGNYLAFFSSFDYLEQAVDELRRRHPQIPLWQQTRRMGEAERAEFLGRFTPDGRGIGFAVLGGAFAEGVDLPGTRLIGAFIATLGLPQVNPVNEEMRRRIDADFGAGQAYTYLYPGLRKVVQAAGRVIRSVDDRGWVWLIDDRFARREVRALLPRWWHVELGSSTAMARGGERAAADASETTGA